MLYLKLQAQDLYERKYWHFMSFISTVNGGFLSNFLHYYYNRAKPGRGVNYE